MRSVGQSALTLIGLFVITLGPLSFPADSAAGDIVFNRDIRPILAENCFYCHGQDSNKRQADLRLDDRTAAVESGAIVPGDAKSSSLIERILSSDPDQQMPPPKSNRHLTDAQRDLLSRWIADGAVYTPHWAFQTPTQQLPPESSRSDWARNAIDRFVAAKLDEHSLTPSPEAGRAVLIKRLMIDLIGLPPTPEEVESFVHNDAPDAYERLVDRLLASPRLGERLALPWLDAARYADSNGFQQDGDTWQWIWRDWVVRAMNEDLPFDQFTIWQLAGDLLPGATTDQKIASGFNRNHLLNGEGGAIAEEQRWVILFDRMDTTATTWLGMTMACAQCHNHKYDPLTLKDYYSLLEGFNRVPESGVPQRFSSRIRVAPPLIELPTPENDARIAEFDNQIRDLEGPVKKLFDAAYEGWQAGITAESNQLSDETKGLLKKPENERTDDEKKKLAADLRKAFDEKVRPGLQGKFPEAGSLDSLKKQMAEYKADQIPRVMIMSDEKPRETFILERGEYLKPTATKVSFATPEFLPPLPQDAPKNRLGFAQWLVSAEHPLTSRVQVNRIWQHFFGQGIIKTAEDFGVQSEYPVHGALLDWLAVEFRTQGWSSKRLQRELLLSTTYRQSSRITAEAKERDPENKLFARAGRFRMPSMVLRDWALSASGLIDKTISGAPVYPYQPDAVWEALAITKERDFTYPLSTGKDLYRRSIYTFWRRTVQPADMFDSSNRQTCRVRTSLTSTPLHALTTLNDPAWVEAARVLAERVMKQSADSKQQLSHAFELATCRKPNDKEIVMLQTALERQRSFFKADDEQVDQAIKVGASTPDATLPKTELAAMTQVCLAILNLDESLTRE